MVHKNYKHLCQAHGFVLAWSTSPTWRRTGGGKFPNGTFQTAGEQTTSRQLSSGTGWSAGLVVRWSVFCYKCTTCGPSVPGGLHHCQKDYNKLSLWALLNNHRIRPQTQRTSYLQTVRVWMHTDRRANAGGGTWSDDHECNGRMRKTNKQIITIHHD